MAVQGKKQRESRGPARSQVHGRSREKVKGNSNMSWLTKFPASEGVHYFWNEARSLYPKPPQDLDEATKRVVAQLGPKSLDMIRKGDALAEYSCWARLAVGFWEMLLTHRVTPSVAKSVREMELASKPTGPPYFMRRTWLIEVPSPLTGDRLYGDTTALGGFQDPKSGDWGLVGWRLVNGQPQMRTMVTNNLWSPGTQSAQEDSDETDEQGDPKLYYRWCEGGWEPTVVLTEDEYQEHDDWFRAAVQFAMTFGILLEAENTNLHTRDVGSIPDRGRPNKPQVPHAPKWITRYVNIDNAKAALPVTKATSLKVPEGLPPKEGMVWMEVPVREHLRWQRYGEHNQQRRWIRIRAHLSHRWAPPNPRRVVVRDGQ